VFRTYLLFTMTAVEVLVVHLGCALTKSLCAVLQDSVAGIKDYALPLACT
jgi:hypothetical protein